MGNDFVESYLNKRLRILLICEPMLHSGIGCTSPETPSWLTPCIANRLFLVDYFVHSCEVFFLLRCSDNKTLQMLAYVSSLNLAKVFIAFKLHRLNAYQACQVLRIRWPCCRYNCVSLFFDSESILKFSKLRMSSVSDYITAFIYVLLLICHWNPEIAGLFNEQN